MARYYFSYFKNYIFLIAAVCFTGLSGQRPLFAVEVSPGAAVEGSPKIAVMDFQTAGDEADLGETVAEILRTTLTGTGKYAVVERGLLKEALKGREPGLSGASDKTTAVGIGKVLGAKLVAVGSVVKTSDTYTLSVSFVDVATGGAVSEKELTTGSKEEFPGLCGLLVGLLTVSEAARGLKVEPPPAIKPAEAQAVEAGAPPADGSLALGGLDPEASLKYITDTPAAAEGPKGIKGLLNLNVNYPGAGLRYFFSGSTALELRGQYEKNITVIGARLYLFQQLFKKEGFIPYLGIEGDYGSFKGAYSKGGGFAGGGFAGVEYFLGRSLSVQTDVGASYLSLKDTDSALAQSGLEFIISLAVNIYLR